MSDDDDDDCQQQQTSAVCAREPDDEAEDVLDAIGGLDGEPMGDVVLDDGRDDLALRVLKDEADPFADVGKRGAVVSPYETGALRRDLQSAQNFYESRFAGSVMP